MSLKPRRVNFDETWAQLLETVQGVITCGRVERAVWNDRFSDVYVLCVAYPEPQAERLYKETRLFLETLVQQLHKEIEESGEECILSCYNRHWSDFSRGSDYLNQLYGYLNTQVIKKQKFTDADINYGQIYEENAEQMLEVGELALDTWRRLLLEPLKDVLLGNLLKQIHQDRTGGSVNQSVLHGVINSFCDVERYKQKHKFKFYEEAFETSFLEETADFYRQVSQTMREEYTCTEYIEKAIQRLDEEDYRSRKFLVEGSYAKVTRECERVLVAEHLAFLHEECPDIVTHENRKDLRHMYRLLMPPHIRGLDKLTSEVQRHIKETALAPVQGLSGENMPAQFVEGTIEVHSKYSELIKDVFNNDQQFTSALDKAFISVINYRENPKHHCKSPEIVSKYYDTLLKKSAKGLTESEIDDKLSAAITVFKYLDDKDIFQRFYARMLAKRLIYSQSQSMDAEEGMINRLKQACGYQFTNKLHRMFTDISLSAGLNTSFTEFTKNCQPPLNLGVSFSILVLQAGAWPLGQSNLPSFNIPQELEQSVKKFETFYSSNFRGRKLTWMHNLCSAELRLNYLKKVYMVNMTTFQMSVLLAFNAQNSLRVSDVREVTSLQEGELLRQIQTLLDAKLLKCQGALIEESQLSLNMEYSNKRTRFKIIAASQKETPQEVEQTRSAADDDRKLYLQAAIVRTMKARKRLKHNLLIQEVISQSRGRFTPSVPMIKKCIEALIEKQYLERTKSATDEYSYVA